MKKIKFYVKRILLIFINKLFFRLGPYLYFTNWFFQKVLRINSESSFLVHYTSRVTSAKKIFIEDDENMEVLFSIAVSHGCYIQAVNGIYFGKGTIFAPNVTIVSAGHKYSDYSVLTKNKAIFIGKYCWLGASSVICPGVKLGDHTVVGAGSVVTKSFPDGYVVVGGVPARIIKFLDKEQM